MKGPYIVEIKYNQIFQYNRIEDLYSKRIFLKVS